MFKSSSRDFCFTTVVNLRQEDLHRGIPKQPDSCPVQRQLHRAVARRFRRWDFDLTVGVNFATIVLKGKNEDTELVAPLEGVRDTVKAIDNGSGTTPGTKGAVTFHYNRNLPKTV